MQVTAAYIAELLGGDVKGNPETIIRGPGKIEDAGEGDITFLANMKYEPFVYSTKASAVLVSLDFVPKQPIAATLIRVPDVYAAITLLLQQFSQQAPIQVGISKLAFVHDKATLGEKVAIGRFSIVEEGAKIGKGTIVHDQVYVGKNAEIGENCILYPGVRILRDCIIGNDCILNANAVIGCDGFGFLPKEDGSYEKIPQTGNVLLGDCVEIGSNTTIDRATMGSTLIETGAKLDNLVQVAHNVVIGKNTVVAAQAGFAGSSKIGARCMIGGQAGFVGHIQVADGTKIQAQSGVNKNLNEDGAAWYGSPILPYKDYLRSYAMFRKLPDMAKRIRELEKKLNDLEGK